MLPLVDRLQLGGPLTTWGYKVTREQSLKWVPAKQTCTTQTERATNNGFSQAGWTHERARRQPTGDRTTVKTDTKRHKNKVKICENPLCGKRSLMDVMETRLNKKLMTEPLSSRLSVVCVRIKVFFCYFLYLFEISLHKLLNIEDFFLLASGSMNF